MFNLEHQTQIGRHRTDDVDKPGEQKRGSGGRNTLINTFTKKSISWYSKRGTNGSLVLPINVLP